MIDQFNADQLWYWWNQGLSGFRLHPLYYPELPVWIDSLQKEVKGTITLDDSHYGSLAKLPCFGAWDEDRLAAFVATPPRRLDWLIRKTAELEKATPKGRPKVKARRGSTSGLPFGVEEVEHLLGSKAVRHRAAYLYAMHVAPRRGRLAVQDFIGSSPASTRGGP